MSTEKAKPAWVKDKNVAEDFEVIDVPRWDDIKDFVFDKEGCYVLIKIYRETHDTQVILPNSLLNVLQLNSYVC